MAGEPYNEPAFPETKLSTAGTADGMDYTVSATVRPGMTLRDYFAGQALAGMMANQCYSHDPGCVSQSSYAFADAMIKEHNKESE